MIWSCPHECLCLIGISVFFPRYAHKSRRQYYAHIFVSLSYNHRRCGAVASGHAHSLRAETHGRMCRISARPMSSYPHTHTVCMLKEDLVNNTVMGDAVVRARLLNAQWLQVCAFFLEWMAQTRWRVSWCRMPRQTSSTNVTSQHSGIAVPFF